MTTRRPSTHDWLSLKRDGDTGIESIRAHFRGHAYDPHDHDEWLVGITLQGVQSFRCRRRQQVSTPGRLILIEPLERHDGESPEPGGFTYAMLYLPQSWLRGRCNDMAATIGRPVALGFRHTLADDPALAGAVGRAFAALHGREGRLARDLALDRLVTGLIGWAPAVADRRSPVVPVPVRRALALLEDKATDDIGLAELATAAGCDRFRLHRLFRECLGVSPHRYLVTLRLRLARKLLAQGCAPATVATEVGFADQSHLGRWFRRAYRLTPAAYRRLCTDVPDAGQAHT